MNDFLSTAMVFIVSKAAYERKAKGSPFITQTLILFCKHLQFHFIKQNK